MEITVDKLKIEIELQALITEREGMKAENQFRRDCNSAVAYGEDSFCVLADKMRALAVPPFIVPEGAAGDLSLKDLGPSKVILVQEPKTLRCSLCNKICNAGEQPISKKVGDICKAVSSKGEGIERCPGVLRKG